MSSRTRARSSAKPADDGPLPRNRDREVYDTAAEIFARKGYAASTVQDVADELGILKGSLYYYIKTKEDLLFRLLEEIHEDVDALLEDIKASGETDPVELLRQYVRTQAAYNLRSLTKISVYYNDLEQLSEDRRKQIFRRRKVHEDFVQSLIADAQKQQRITSKRDPAVLANAVFAIVIWPYRWFKPRGKARLDDVVDACVEFVCSGIGAAN